MDRHKNLWVGLIVIFILDRINRIDWIYCFLGFLPPARRAYASERRNREIAIFLLERQKNPVDPV